MIIQPINNIAEICVQQGVVQAVLCPGSRSAPLTLAFARHPNIETFVMSDERSAGYVAMGLAQSSQKPVVLICTSGTAVANLYPAIIEAFYQQIPLLVLTADRPPEWIDQQEGQTIRQQNIYQNHVIASYQFPVSFENEEETWHAEKMISEAILKTKGSISGPVHVNIPIREPFYPAAEEDFHYSHKIKVIESFDAEGDLIESDILRLVRDIEKHNKIMVLVGQAPLSGQLISVLNSIQKKIKWVIIGDITSNTAGINHHISKHDIILKNLNLSSEYTPDLLITFGLSVLSKGLKTFLRNEIVKDHWHVSLSQETVDSYKSLTKNIHMAPDIFFAALEKSPLSLSKAQNTFFNLWTQHELQAHAFVEDFFKVDHMSEFHTMVKLLKNLPQQCHLHLANSMPVRYANLLGINGKMHVSVWSNRGTSGIDGCLSTCVGHAINSSSLNILITGDMAFFYDRNGLWHNHIPQNLRIVILNNHGGGIFRLINGPKQLDELEEYFETQQNLNAANTARDFGFKYYNLKNIEVLPELLVDFFKAESGPSILEIETQSAVNQKVFEDFNQKATQFWK